MSITVLALKTIKKLIPDAAEWEIVPPPLGDNIVRTITRIRFDNHDTTSHTPTFSVREADLDKVKAELPELWRVHVPRSIATKGSFEDCGVVTILEPNQSLVVILAAAPSDLTDDQKWPAVTVNFMDQSVTQTATAPISAESTDITKTIEGLLQGNFA